MSTNFEKYENYCCYNSVNYLNYVCSVIGDITDSSPGVVQAAIMQTQKSTIASVEYCGGRYRLKFCAICDLFKGRVQIIHELGIAHRSPWHPAIIECSHISCLQALSWLSCYIIWYFIFKIYKKRGLFIKDTKTFIQLRYILCKKNLNARGSKIVIEKQL